MKRFKKTPRMFSKFTSMFHSAVEVLAPNLPLQQAFTTHWKAVTHYFIDNKDQQVSVDQTSLPLHMDQMAQLLVEEESTADSGLTGPCLEYLLHHKVLDTLYTLARSDSPPGMKQVVLQFFTKLLSRIKQPILPHVNVYKPLQRLVRLCGQVSASPAEREEVQLICVLCAILKTDPYLVNFFIQPPKSASNSSSPRHMSTKGGDQPVSQSQGVLQLMIVEALLNLMESNDSWVSVKACEGILLCCSLPEQSAVQCILSSQFMEYIVSRLCTLYSKLPKTMDPADVECIRAKWGWDFLSDTEDQSQFAGKRQLISFLSWLDYCDQLVALSQQEISQTLTRNIRDYFLCGLLQPAILQVSEGGATTATAHLYHCIHLVSAPTLLNEFVYFTLGPSSSSSECDTEAHRVRDKLIDRCNHLSDELSITTLKLFESLLHKQHPHILETLVLQYLNNRSYVDLARLPCRTSSTDNDLPFSDIDSDQEHNAQLSFHSGANKQATITELVDELGLESLDEISVKKDSIHVNDLDDAAESNSVLSDKEQSDSDSQDRTLIENEKGSCESANDDKNNELDALKPAEDLTAKTCTEEHSLSSELTNVGDHSVSHADIEMDPSMTTDVDPDEELTVHTIVNSFLCILGEECKSSYQLGDTGYETYLRDAHKELTTLMVQCQQYNWPSLPVTPPEFNDQPFHEGPFLKVLLDRLTHMLDQSYDVNLHVTSVVSRLALMPHPNIHEYLLHPMLPVKAGCRTLPKVLEKVAHDIKMRVKPIGDYHKKLIGIRKQLMGFSDTYRSLEHANALTGVIVLEEFCKELAAITFVKYHEAAAQL